MLGWLGLYGTIIVLLLYYYVMLYSIGSSRENVCYISGYTQKYVLSLDSTIGDVIVKSKIFGLISWVWQLFRIQTG